MPDRESIERKKESVDGVDEEKKLSVCSGMGVFCIRFEPSPVGHFILT